jgi:hypothetical protein
MSGQGKFLANRVARSPHGTIVMDHVVERFWERWPDSRHLSNAEVRTFITKQVDEARRDRTFMKVPGGHRVHISFMGQDGWAVVVPDGNVVTVFKEEK